MEIKTKISNFLKTNKTISNILGDFEIGKQLGEGGTSTVRLAKIGDVEFAIKFLAENIHENETTVYKRFKQAYLNLIRLQNSGYILNHIHFDAVRISDDCLIPYCILEKADETLSDYKKRKELDFKTFEAIFKMLGMAIQMLHDNGIIHRDLKPENIFIKQKRLAIGDFDIAKFCDADHIKLVETKNSDRLANYYFSAPEQSSKQYGELTTAADWFAFGQILHWLITGYSLKGQSHINITTKDSSYVKYRAIINKLLQQEPKNRPQNFKEILESIESNIEVTHNHNRERDFLRMLQLFNEIINKFTIGLGGRSFKEIIDSNAINQIMEELRKKCKKMELWWSQGASDNHLDVIKKLDSIASKTSNQEHTRWLVQYFEIDIKSIWIYKYGDIGCDVIIIETKAMPSFGVFNRHYEAEQAVLFKQHYIPSSHYDEGWTEIDGKIMKVTKAETRVRHLYNDIFFISPYASPIIGYDGNMEIVNSIYLRYRETGVINEELLAPLRSLKRSHRIEW